MSNNISVSVILPSLNVKQYICECVESVINQTLDNIEIICVDAGSTDGTLEILESYASRDERINLIVADKKSYGYQMNLGVRAAKGKYVGIVETDDYVPVEMYEELYSLASSENLDFVKADFYRFTGRGETLSKGLYKLSGNVLDYGKVIDVSEQQKVFGFVMNTWSGIYKREFLLKNNIWHNETPGASYQDNGFWFQTFIYAKRAFFVSKPYYMNRRDNENSSVYSKGKVFCICDEYDYIYNILSNNPKLKDVFGFSFGLACFRAYRSNLNRISNEYKKNFILRWSSDFRKYRDEGMLNYRDFGDVDWDYILRIINEPESFYEEEILREELFYEEAKKHKNIIIYGAGMIGHRVLDNLKYCSNPADVMCFAVTKKENNVGTYKGVEIKPICELVDYKESAYVIVATTNRYQLEIVEMLEDLEFKNVVLVPYSEKKSEEFYSKLTQEQRKIELEKWYRRTTGKELCLDNPKSIEEKQQWMKLYDNSKLKRYLSDKLNARKWVSDRIGKKYLTEIVGIYENASDISLDTLPEQFIIKCTHGSRMNSFVIHKSDIKSSDWDSRVRRINSNLKSNFAYGPAMELFYEEAIPRVIVEKMVSDKFKEDNYKFVCENGKIKYIISEKGKMNRGSLTRDFFDAEWNHLDIKKIYRNADVLEKRPIHLEEMIRIAEILSEGFDYVVIHLFDTCDGVKFNEIKFLLDSGV